MTPAPRSSRFLSGLRSTAKSFVRDEDGSATIWSLLWMLLFVGMAGLAIDSTNAWRVETMLTSTTDVATLAGTWDLPEEYLDKKYADTDYSAVRDSAMSWAQMNMSMDEYGGYITKGTDNSDSDILIGHWDFAARKFYPGHDPINAVYVEAGRNAEKQNAQPTTMLRVAGLMGLPGMFWYEINTRAVGVYGVHECHMNGLIAREGFHVSGNFKVMNETCLHGQLSMKMTSSGTFYDGVDTSSVTVGDTPDGIVGGDQNFDVKDATTESGDPVVFPSDPTGTNEQDIYPLMVDAVPTIGYGIIAGWEHFRHLGYPSTELVDGSWRGAVQLPDGLLEVTGSTDVGNTSLDPATRFGWLRGSVELASLDGFASVAGLLGFAAKPVAGPTTMPGWQYDEATGEVISTPTQEYSEDILKNKNNFDWTKDTTLLKSSDPTLKANLSPFTGTLVSGKTTLPEEAIYFQENCSGGQPVTLSGVIENITFITNCRVVLAKDAHIQNAVILTTSGYNKNDNASGTGIDVSNGVVLGAPTACQDWGGVRLMSAGNIDTAGTGNKFDAGGGGKTGGEVTDGTGGETTIVGFDDNNDGVIDTYKSQYWGVQMIARRDIYFAGKSDSEKGISLHAGGAIHFAGQAEIAGLTLGVDATETQLGNCPDGVGIEVDKSAFFAVLVE